jgi:MtN3 and saliva related transmembrane protein
LSTGEILGLVAGIFSTFSVVPQIIKIFKYKSAKDISFIFSTMFALAGFLWLAYGIVDHLVPIIFWNAVGVTLNLVMLIGKIRYSKNEIRMPPVTSKIRMLFPSGGATKIRHQRK